MSPLKINMLLAIYALTRDYRDEQANRAHANSAAVAEAFSFFEREGLATKVADDLDWKATAPSLRSAQHKLTERGRALVQALQDVQLPVAVWVQPPRPLISDAA